ncbi:MAG: hypothetical protein WDN47_01970 [Candidatus Doudnabacteria bacterium]
MGSEQVRPKISRWLRDLAQQMRNGHVNNVRYAEPYDLAAGALDEGDPLLAREIIESHQLYTTNEDKRTKYLKWMQHLDQA